MCGRAGKKSHTAANSQTNFDVTLVKFSSKLQTYQKASPSCIHWAFYYKGWCKHWGGHLLGPVVALIPVAPTLFACWSMFARGTSDRCTRCQYQWSSNGIDQSVHYSQLYVRLSYSVHVKQKQMPSVKGNCKKKNVLKMQI